MIERRKRTLESIALTTLTKGKYFYTLKTDKEITAIASYYEKKVKTERVFILNPQTGKTNKAVKVTIL